MPAQHRKHYNWLEPSTAGASHHGPLGRAKAEEKEKEKERQDSGAGADADAVEVKAEMLEDYVEEEGDQMNEGGREEDEDEDEASLAIREALGEDIDPRSNVQGADDKTGSQRKRLDVGLGKAWRRGLKK